MQRGRLLALSILAVLGACSDGGSSGGGMADLAPPMQDNMAPTITGLSDQALEADTPEQSVMFSVADDATAPGNLTVSATSSDPAVLPDSGLQLAGQGAERTLLVSPRPGVLGEVTVTVRVEDAMAAFTEQSVRLTLHARQAAFGAYLRDVFAAGSNADPFPVNTVEFSVDGTDFNDLLQ